MFRVLINVISPLISLLLLILGNGFFVTYITVRLHLAGTSPGVIGLISAAFYLGLVIGSFRIEPLIMRIGHIRAYTGFASLTTVMILLQAIYLNPWSWFFLRFLSGWCMAALFITIESWLLAKSTQKTRGQILSLYLIIFYAAQAGGQFLMRFGDLNGTLPFILTALLSALSVVPLAMTRTTTPHYDEPSTLNFSRLYQTSPIGVIGCFAAGLIMGAIYSLLPLYISQIKSIQKVDLFMGILITGGMLLQYPLGKISDVFDRRKVILITTVLMLTVTVVMIMPFSEWNILFPLFLFVFGGLAFTLYPLNISYTCDHLESKDIVAATQGLLLAYSIGAAIAPVLPPGLMCWFGPHGLFIYFLIVASFFLILVMWRSLTSPGVPKEQQEKFVTVARTTPIASELDPRQSRRSSKWRRRA